MPNLVVPQHPEDDIVIAERAFRSSVAAYISALTMSGTTATRPISFLWVGRTYYDTTLQRPIWLRDLSPAVWIRADGVVV